jgi:hypothetical protein
VTFEAHEYRSVLLMAQPMRRGPRRCSFGRHRLPRFLDDFKMDPLVSTDWRAGEQQAPSLRIIDASDHVFQPERGAGAEFANCRIPGVVFLDIASFRDKANPLPLTSPTARAFDERFTRRAPRSSRRVSLTRMWIGSLTTDASRSVFGRPRSTITIAFSSRLICPASERLFRIDPRRKFGVTNKFAF